MSHFLFPQFNRFFSAPPVRRTIALVSRVGIMTLVVALIGINMAELRKQRLQQPLGTVLGTATDARMNSGESQQTLEQEYTQWQQIIKMHPDYRDGYYTLSLLAYQLNLTSEARNYLLTVKRLDPNYAGIPQMEALLSQE